MKANFKKWVLENKQDSIDGWTIGSFLIQDEINQFAEEYAENSVIEYIMFSEGCSRKEAEEYYKFNIHYKFKDNET